MVIESRRIHFQSNVNEETKEDTPPNSLALFKDYHALLWNRGWESSITAHMEILRITFMKNILFGGFLMKIKLQKVFQNVCHFLFEINYYFFQYMVSLYNLNYPRTHSVEKTGLKPAEICLPMPPECWYFNTSRLEITFKYLYQTLCTLKYY